MMRSLREMLSVQQKGKRLVINIFLNDEFLITTLSFQCWLPSLSLLEVIQRESGMPVRKPPPNLIKK